MVQAKPIPTRGYLICSVERTGSSFFAQALTRTGLAGRPIEYFNPGMQDKPRMRAILGDHTMIDGISEILAAGTTHNGVFGAKLHCRHLAYLALSIAGKWNLSHHQLDYKLLRAQSLDNLPVSAALEFLHRERPEFAAWQDTSLAFIRSQLPELQFIWLRRENMVARAISHFRASRTSRWYQTSGQQPTTAAPDPDFDFAEIHVWYCLGIFWEEMLRQFFARHQIVPHGVSYEELDTDYERTVRGTLRFLDVGGPDTPIPPPRSAKQADALSLDWERRYREIAPARGL